MFIIDGLAAMEVLDSRGRPTVAPGSCSSSSLAIVLSWWAAALAALAQAGQPGRVAGWESRAAAAGSTSRSTVVSTDAWPIRTRSRVCRGHMPRLERSWASVSGCWKLSLTNQKR